MCPGLHVSWAPPGQASILGSDHPSVRLTRQNLSTLAGLGDFVSIEPPPPPPAGPLGTLRVTVLALEKKSLRPTRLKAEGGGGLVALTAAGEDRAVGETCHFCWHPLSVAIETPTKGRGDVSKMTELSPMAIRARCRPAPPRSPT